MSRNRQVHLSKPVVVGLAVVKELGPVLTAIMVAGRAGSGISAELGSMRGRRS